MRVGSLSGLGMAAWWAIVLTLALGASLAVAQQGASLGLSFDGGTVRIGGSGFKPLETVDMQVRVEGVSEQFSATADTEGRFHTDTDVAVRAGQEVEITARGNLGTVVSTQAVAPPGVTPGAVEPEPEGLTTGMIVIAVGIGVAVGMLFAGLMALQRQRNASRQ